MTIKYALTKAEIARSFFQGLRSSPKFLAIILTYSFGLGLFSLATRGAFSRSLTFRDALITLGWMIGTFFFLPLWLFIRGKTDERVLTLSQSGISTEVGSMRGQVPWSKVKAVTDTDRYVLIVGVQGNAFFIPHRAFSGPDQQAQFVAEINHWRNTGR